MVNCSFWDNKEYLNFKNQFKKDIKIEINEGLEMCDKKMLFNKYIGEPLLPRIRSLKEMMDDRNLIKEIEERKKGFFYEEKYLNIGIALELSYNQIKDLDTYLRVKLNEKKPISRVLWSIVNDHLLENEKIYCLYRYGILISESNIGKRL